MTLVYYDRVKSTTTTTGTGTYTLGSAATGYQDFSVVGNGNTCYYAASDGTNWEVGLGTYTSSGTTLARTNVLASSNSGSAVNWGAGSKDIWLDFPALVASYLAGGTTGTGPLVLSSGPTITLANGTGLPAIGGLAGSGQTLVTFRPQQSESPASLYGIFGTRNAHPYIAFDDTTNWNIIWTNELPKQYTGGGLTVLIYWAAASATSGNVVWNAYIERDNINSQNMDSDNFSSAQTTTTAALGTSGLLASTSITFTSGAQMSSLVAGEQFRLKVERNGASGSDTMTGNAQVFLVIVRET